MVPTVDWVESNCPPVLRKYKYGSEAPTPDVFEPEVDEQTLRKAYVNVTAGACFSLGLRYIHVMSFELTIFSFSFAGSANQDAKRCLMHFADLFASPTLEGKARV